MKKSNQPAFPTQVAINEEGICAPQIGSNTWLDLGLSKREYFAAMAMQGLVQRVDRDKMNLAAQWAVKAADDLLAELEK